MSKDIDESRDDVREFWQMVIELWRASGLSVREFCEREGVSAASLYGWRKRIGKMDQSQVCQEQDSELSSFIEVSMPTGEVGVLELVLTSGNTLKMSAGIDGETLAYVISILQRVGLC